MKAGPKVAVDGSSLSLRGSRRRELAVARFALDAVRVPRGHGARKPLRLRPWQRSLIASTWDARPRPRMAGWMLPRGQGKTSLTAVLVLYELLAGPEGAQVVVVATDERQAGLCHRAASRMVELHPALEQRVQQYADALIVPTRGASFQVLPAVPKRLEGLDYTWPSWMRRAASTRRSMRRFLFATGKQKTSVGFAIGTPGPELEQTVLGAFVPTRSTTRRTRWSGAGSIPPPGSRTIRWTGPTAGSWRIRPWEISSPGTGWRQRLPPKMREASFRRAGLCQLTDQLEDAWPPPSAWAAC
jgi:hypothetical protein